MSPILTEMPDKVIQQILKNCEYPATQSLRKVCHRLRNFIDDFKPNYKLRRIEIELRGNNVILELWTNTNTTRYMRFSYRKHENGCLIVADKFVEKRRNVVKNEDFLNIFFEDLTSLLVNLKTCLESFHLGLTYSEFDYGYRMHEDMEPNSVRLLDWLKTTLQYRARPIMIEDFSMKVTNQQQIMQILPLVEHTELRRISFQNSNHTQKKILELDQIVKTDQWKSARKLTIRSFLVSEDLRNFWHFESPEVFHLQDNPNFGNS